MASKHVVVLMIVSAGLKAKPPTTEPTKRMVHHR